MMGFRPTNTVLCLCCLEERAEVRIAQKTGRPTVFCPMCKSRTFINSPSGLLGLHVVAPRLTGLLRGMDLDQLRDEAASEFDRKYGTDEPAHAEGV